MISEVFWDELCGPGPKLGKVMRPAFPRPNVAWHFVGCGPAWSILMLEFLPSNIRVTFYAEQLSGPFGSRVAEAIECFVEQLQGPRRSRVVVRCVNSRMKRVAACLYAAGSLGFLGPRRTGKKAKRLIEEASWDRSIQRLTEETSSPCENN